jgi:hypothetical protein
VRHQLLIKRNKVLQRVKRVELLDRERFSVVSVAWTRGAEIRFDAGVDLAEDFFGPADLLRSWDRPYGFQ